MSASSDTVNMALFCDFENVALGVRDAKYEEGLLRLGTVQGVQIRHA